MDLTGMPDTAAPGCDSAPGDEASDQLLAERIARAIDAWSAKLVDVTGRNNLLNYRDLRIGTLELTDADEVALGALLSGQKIELSQAFTPDDVASAARRCRAIRARAEENFEERGIQTLYVAWGMATWANTRGTFTPCAPILLRQAHLVARGGAGEDFSLSLPGEWEVNPTLLHVLGEDFGLQIDVEALLDLLEGDGGSPNVHLVFERLGKEAARVRLGGFEATGRVVLANFSYAKLPMVRDLQAAAGLMVQNALVSAIAGDPTAADALRNRHADVADSAPDRTAPADEFLVLDADASQNYAINAVLAGADLVIDGPPGTGKSQTIANLIATLAARGKRVLFVAEKRAAIDAVLGRLEKVGLADLVLDLHDGASAKSRIVGQFAKALTDASCTPPVDMSGAQVRLARRRDALVRRAHALHDERAPWGVSVYKLESFLTGVPETARSTQRLGANVLASLTAETMPEVEANLERFVDIGGLDIAASGSPWLAAMAAGSIATPEEAGMAMEAVTHCAQESLPRTATLVTEALSSVGLRTPGSIDAWAQPLELLSQVATVLEQFDSSVFTLDVDTLLGALAPADAGPIARMWHGIVDRKYKGALSALRACTKELGTASGVMAASLRSVRSVLDAWNAVTDDGVPPRLPGDLPAAIAAHHELMGELGTLGQLLGDDALRKLAPDVLAARLRACTADRETLYRLPEIRRLGDSLQSAGLLGLTAELRHRNVTAVQAVACLHYVWRASVLDAICIADPEIGTFDGEAHSRIAAEFRRADVEHIATTPARIRRAVAEHVVSVRDAYPEESSLVTREAAKKRKHLPMRQFFEQAPHVLSALKPCWAMSPLVVAQVLPLTRTFDTVIFDEASQVAPESAIGAIIRADRAVVAGDPHQLPPTAFFASGAIDDRDEDAEDDVADAAMTKDIESVLDLMVGLLPPPNGTRRLSWHYRSRDERLIAFSNARPSLYDWTLTTFPGADAGDAISHELAPFVLGRPGQEESAAEEVNAVVRMVTEHAHHRPTESLGVITMGVRHMDRITEALRRARQGDRALDAFMDAVLHENEKLFVKNLERVQGDERDAIIISIGYAKSVDGRMMYRFGPINNPGGERRLNVAITRARTRMQVVSSFSSTDMDPAKCRSEGARMLRDYLRYAESGGRDLGPALREHPPLNPFEDDVRVQLSAAGLALECQVGCSGYWIDFAVKHPDEPGRFVLAIEADGVMYHSSATARDRDRLRQDHLERLGWRFHRIWSSEWFRHRDREVERAVAAYEDALRGPAAVIVDPVTAPDPPHEAGGSEAREIAPPGVPPAPYPQGPKPVAAGRGSIVFYSHEELVALIRWIDADGLLRTHDELITEAVRELGFKRRGSRVVAALDEAVTEVHRA